MANLRTNINVQIDNDDIEQATIILQELGISMSEFINMTIKQLILQNGIPFDVSIPKNEFELNKYFSKDELENTAKEIAYIERYPEEYKSYNNIIDLKNDLLSKE